MHVPNCILGCQCCVVISTYAGLFVFLTNVFLLESFTPLTFFLASLATAMLKR